MSVRRIFAIAGISYLDALRNKIFLSLFIFLVIALVASFNMPSMSEAGRITVMQSYMLQAIILFSSVISIFLSSFSLASDIQDRRLMLILSTPVRRLEILLGKILGITLIMASLLFCTGLISLVSLYSVSNTGSLPEQYMTVEADNITYTLRDEAKEHGELTGRYWLNSGDDSHNIHYQFTGLDSSKFGDTITAELFYVTTKMNHFNVKMDNQRAIITIEGQSTFQQRPSLLQKKGSLNFSFPSSLISSDGSLDIYCARDKKSTMYGVRKPEQLSDKQGLRLYGNSISYSQNLSKSLLLILMGNIFLISLCVAGSTCLTAPVTIMLGLSLLIGGNMLSYVKGSIVILLNTPTQTASNNDNHDHDKDQEQENVKVERKQDLEAFLSDHPVLLKAFGTCMDMLPNLSYYSPKTWLKQAISIPLSFITRAFYYMAFYSLLFTLVGYGFFVKFEMR